jgi:preprotein translocase subunit Sec61beta
MPTEELNLDPHHVVVVGTSFVDVVVTATTPVEVVVMPSAPSGRRE